MKAMSCRQNGHSTILNFKTQQTIGYIDNNKPL